MATGRNRPRETHVRDAGRRAGQGLHLHAEGDGGGKQVVKPVRLTFGERAVFDLRPDFAADKKPDDKKPGDKKPDDKKPGDKKPERRSRMTKSRERRSRTTKSRERRSRMTEARRQVETASREGRFVTIRRAASCGCSGRDLPS